MPLHSFTVSFQEKDRDMYERKIPVDTKCGIVVFMELMGGKWKPWLINHIHDGSTSPSSCSRAFLWQLNGCSLSNWGNSRLQDSYIKECMPRSRCGWSISSLRSARVSIRSSRRWINGVRATEICWRRSDLMNSLPTSPAVAKYDT